MDSKYPQSQAPLADAKSLDFSKLVIVDSSKPPSSTGKTHKPSSSAEPVKLIRQPASVKFVDSQRPSSSTLGSFDSHRPSTTKIGDSRSSSSSNARSVNTQRSRQTLPPPYQTYVNVAKDSRAGYKDLTRTLYPEDKKLHSQGSSSQNHVSQRAADNSRIPTNKSPIGAMDRTYFEGQALKTEFSDNSNSRRGSSRTTLPRQSIAPPFARTILKNPEDIKMASRQTQYKTLALDERQKQDKWAQTMIKRTGSCPEGFDWERVDEGYRCKGRHHIITDELLREGMGGVMVLPDAMILHFRVGPYYEDPDKQGVFKYGGPFPQPDQAPDYIGGSSTRRGTSNRGSVPFFGSNAHIAKATGASMAHALRTQRYPTGHPNGSHQGSIRYTGI